MSRSHEDFVADYPEFAGLPPGVVERQREQAAIMLAPQAWGKWLDMARDLWTAHYLALEYDISEACKNLGRHSPNEVGSVSSLSASAGSLSVSRTSTAMLGGDDPLLADFARTTYGLRYLNLLHTVIPPGAVVYSPDTSAARGRG